MAQGQTNPSLLIEDFLRKQVYILSTVKSWSKQGHLRMNDSIGLNNHLRSIDHFDSLFDNLFDSLFDSLYESLYNSIFDSLFDSP